MEGFESFIGIDFWTALFVLLNTLAIFFVARKYLYGPVMMIITERQQEIDDMYQAADEAKTQARTMEAEYQQKLTAAQQTSEAIVKDAVARGQRREEDIIRKANADADAIMAKASSDIALEKKKAINDAKNEISGLAMAIAGKVVARELNEADQENMIDRFIEELGDGV